MRTAAIALLLPVCAALRVGSTLPSSAAIESRSVDRRSALASVVAAPTLLADAARYLSTAIDNAIPAFVRSFPLLCSSIAIVMAVSIASLLERTGLPVRATARRMMPGNQISPPVCGVVDTGEHSLFLCVRHRA